MCAFFRVYTLICSQDRVQNVGMEKVAVEVGSGKNDGNNKRRSLRPLIDDSTESKKQRSSQLVVTDEEKSKIIALIVL